MGAFEERERGFEQRMALDAELRFKALARRNRRLGLWVAERSGLAGAAATAFAEDFVAAEVGRDDDEALARTIGEALARAGVAISAHRLRRAIEEAMAVATKEIREG